MFDFHIRGIDGVQDVKKVVAFLSEQDLRYPQYHDWVQRAGIELGDGHKKAILVFSGSKLVGDLLYQWHKSLTGILEIKNLRLAPAVTGHGMARFLLKQVEAEHEGAPIICDLRAYQIQMIEILASCGYVETARLSLYDDNCEDVVMMKAKLTQGETHV